MAEPEHVAGGTFRVDRARLLEKLASFSLADPAQFLIPWLRAASMSGATKVWLWTRPNGIECNFDGRPFAAIALSDPYAPLLDEAGEDGARYRELAIGLLTLLVRGPRSKKGGGPLVELRSGGAEGSVFLRAETYGAESMEAEFGAFPPGTSIRVELPPSKEPWAPGPVARAAEACGGPRSFTFLVDDKEVGCGGPEGGHAALLDGVSANLAIIAPADGMSQLELFSWGVKAGRVEIKLAGFPMAGEVNDDRLTLDATRASVVRDENFERAMAVVSRMGVRIAIDVFKKAMAFIKSRSWYWSAGQDQAAQSLARLRLQCARKISESPAALAELRDALFFVDGRGAPVTLDVLDRRLKAEQLLRLGNHPIRPPDSRAQSRKLKKGQPPPKPAPEIPYIWLTQSQDREALSLLFPGARFVEL